MVKAFWRKGLVLLCLCVLLTMPALADDGFTYHAKHFEAAVLSDARMTVVERQEVSFDNSSDFKKGFVEIKKNGGVRIVDFAVTVNGQVCRKLDVPLPSLAPPNPLECYLYEDDNACTVVWGLDGQKKNVYEISYTLVNAVQVYADTAELYYQFVGTGMAYPVKKITAAINIPVNDSAKPLAWAHGPLNGQVTVESEGRVWLEVDKFPLQTMLEARVAFHQNLLPDYTAQSEKELANAQTERLPTILEEEQEWADSANFERKMSRVKFFGSLGVGALFLIAAVWIALQSRKKRPVFIPEEAPEYYRDLPDDLSPAELFLFFSKKRPLRVSGEKPDITATLLDLSLKGALSIEQTAEGKPTVLFTKKYTELDGFLPHEATLLRLLFEIISENKETVSLKDIKKFGKRRPDKLVESTDKFETGAALQLAARQFGFVGKRPYGGLLFTIGILSMAAIFAVLALDGFWAIPFFGAAILVCLLGPGRMPPFNQKGENHFALWDAFDRFLRDFSLMDEKTLPELALWEKYLVYAVVLGQAKALVKQLPLRYPALQDEAYLSHYPVFWMMYSSNSTMRGDDFSAFTGISKGFNSAISDAHTAMSSDSSGSGGGGGFSGGGGGGGGGGSSGFG